MSYTQYKCHRYWPGAECIVYGEIAVEMMSEKEKEDWTIRELKLSIVRRVSLLCMWKLTLFANY